MAETEVSNCCENLFLCEILSVTVPSESTKTQLWWLVARVLQLFPFAVCKSELCINFAPLLIQNILRFTQKNGSHIYVTYEQENVLKYILNHMFKSISLCSIVCLTPNILSWFQDCTTLCWKLLTDYDSNAKK